MFNDFISLKHLYNSFLIAYRGRNKTQEVIEYKLNLESNLINLREKLLSFDYIHRKYKTFIVEDSKKRVINAPNFEDHILHHAIFRFLEDIFDKKFIENSFANRVGKGTHKAVLKLQKESRNYTYFLKMDITKYFQSIDQEILFSQIKRHVKDNKFLFYVRMIIGSYDEKHILNELTSNKTGMPIGNVTSQLFANIYLHDLDFYVEHTLKPHFRSLGKDLFYIRYVDDFIFLSLEMNDLLLVKKLILDFLEVKLKLSVSPKKLILNKINCGIPFLGYNIFRSKLKVRNDTIRRFKKRLKNKSTLDKFNSLISFKGHCDLANKSLIPSLSNNLLSILNTNYYKYKKQYCILYDSSKGFKQGIQARLDLRCFEIC